MTRQCLKRKYRSGLVSLIMGLVLANSTNAGAQISKTYERNFSEPPSVIQTRLQKMQSAMAGHLPILDGFAVPGEHPFERYQRAYFQATVQVTAAPGGKSIVRATAKVTAWYDDPARTHSGYELLRSNGRIETDILDQLTDELAAEHPPEKKPSSTEPKPEVTSALQTKDTDSAISAPQPRFFDSSSVSSSLSHGIASSMSGPDAGALKAPADPERGRLQNEIAQLQEALKLQAHPNNMAVVRKSGTAVVSTPSLSAKPVFLATAHDEFEILNYNQDWVHVRISGLSRGWIWRNDLEMPDNVPDAPTQASSPRSADFYHVVREETAQFPGDWEPLRGKNVKLISVQKIDESAKESGPELKLEFAKSIFDKSYGEMTQKAGDLAGVVLIFDSADGGMIAASQATLAKWKSGALSDSAFWRSCFFDPPETFAAGGSSGSR